MAVSLKLLTIVDSHDGRGAPLQVSSLRFGPLITGPLPLDCSVTWRELPKGGVGINTNYLMDISPEWRTAGGPTFLESMKVCMRSRDRPQSLFLTSSKRFSCQTAALCRICMVCGYRLIV